MKLVDLDTFIKLPKGTVYVTIFPNKINKDGIIIDSDWVDLPIEIKDDQPRELDSKPYFNGVLYLLPRIENPDCDPFWMILKSLEILIEKERLNLL